MFPSQRQAGHHCRRAVSGRWLHHICFWKTDPTSKRQQPRRHETLNLGSSAGMQGACQKFRRWRSPCTHESQTGQPSQHIGDTLGAGLRSTPRAGSPSCIWHKLLLRSAYFSCGSSNNKLPGVILFGSEPVSSCFFIQNDLSSSSADQSDFLIRMS